MCYAGRLLTDGYDAPVSPVDGRAWTRDDVEAARYMADRAARLGDLAGAASMAKHAAIIAARVG